MGPIISRAVLSLAFVAGATRAADALRIGGNRLRCGCDSSCWCKRPTLTAFRWVVPGRWHRVGLTPEEKRSYAS